MGNPVEINDKVLDESQKLDEKFYRYGTIGFIAFCFVLLLTLTCFIWRFPFFEFDYPIDSERWGQLGDFFGGIIGTIITFLSVIFLYKAFKEQRLANVEAHEVNAEIIKKSEQSSNLNKLQHFDANYCTLLNLYKDAIAGYKSSSKLIPVGKASMSNLISSYIASTTFSNNEVYKKRTKKALNIFNDFFAKNMTVVNAHMRILYQIFNMLTISNIDENDKILYAKLLRSQMTDEELILIRYNCMTIRGNKMQLLVFQYNILKHLPLLGLLEFKKYCKGLSRPQINCINDEFIIWRKEICHQFRIQSDIDKIVEKKYGERYNLRITIRADNKCYTFTMTRKQMTTGPKDMLVKAFDNYYQDDLLFENLLVDFHSELFYLSGFKKYNRNTRFIHFHKNIGTDVIFNIQISQDNPLILSYYQIEHPTHE